MNTSFSNVGATFVSTRPALSRRKFLQGAGILLSLPLLDAMSPAFAVAARRITAGTTPGGKPRRMFGICNNLGLLPEHFFPKESGRDYALSPYLEALKEHRNDFTVFSGVWHPDVDGGHPADNCFLTAAPHPGSAGFRNTISLDQYIGERIGHLTRFPSLTLGVNVQQGVRSLSWTGSGVMIPCEEKAAEVFARNESGDGSAGAQIGNRTEHSRRGSRPGERFAAHRRRPRPRPARSIFYQCARSGTTHADVARMGAQAQTQ